MMTSARLLGGIAAGSILGYAAAAEAELAAPEGPVVLTVVGDIANANRGPMDPTIDRLLDYHAQKFDAAAVFDLEMLEGLGMETRRFVLEGLPGVQELEGPPLAAVLEAVGAKPAQITIMAHDWLVGLKRNGSYLGIGEFGPAWVAFSPAAADQVATVDESQMWPYQVFLIRVEGE
jgi:hypothetical protein